MHAVRVANEVAGNSNSMLIPVLINQHLGTDRLLYMHPPKDVV